MFFPNATFRDQTLKAAEAIIHRHSADCDSDNAMAGFVGVLQADVESGRINLTRMAGGWRRSSLSREEAALALIDGVVSRMKEVADGKPDAIGGMALFIGVLESVVEDEFAENPGRVVPMNGAVGASMTRHMSGFFKTSE